MTGPLVGTAMPSAGRLSCLRALSPHPHLGGVQHRRLRGAGTPLRRIRWHHRHRTGRPPRLALRRRGRPACMTRPTSGAWMPTPPRSGSGNSWASRRHAPSASALPESDGEDGRGDERPRPRRRADRHGRRDGRQEPQGHRPAGTASVPLADPEGFRATVREINAGLLRRTWPPRPCGWQGRPVT